MKCVAVILDSADGAMGSIETEAGFGNSPQNL